MSAARGDALDNLNSMLEAAGAGLCARFSGASAEVPLPAEGEEPSAVLALRRTPSGWAFCVRWDAAEDWSPLLRAPVGVRLRAAEALGALEAALARAADEEALRVLRCTDLARDSAARSAAAAAGRIR